MENKNEWRKVKLGEIDIEIIDGDRGKHYPTLGEIFKNGDCLFLNAKNVTADGFKFEETYFIKKEKDEILKKGKLKKNDIIMTTRGTIGNIALYDSKVKYENIRINSGMVILRNFNFLKFNNEYLYFILKSEKIKNQILQLKTGTAQPQLPISIIKNIEFLLPPIKVQNKIVTILKKIEKKIELNNKINDNLLSVLFFIVLYFLH